MRLLWQRLLIGLAVVAAVVMAIGYAFIAGRIAAPLGGDLAVLPIPVESGARALLLDDGRPAFVVSDGGTVIVVDARGRHVPGAPGRLVAWCRLGSSGVFLDLVGGATYGPDGALRGGPAGEGLVRYPTRETEDGSRFVVGSEGAGAGTTAGEQVALDCPSGAWTVHEPSPAELFDPSVAAAEEPPGWIWLEGRLMTGGGEVRLCDGLDGACATSAPVRGIDPALVDQQVGWTGTFIGRVRDDAIEDLAFVPQPGGAP